MQVGMHTRIGSVTKTFVATLIMQLDQEGVLSLDDTIDEYIDGVPNGDRITLRMLTDMTSGIASYTLTREFVEIPSRHHRPFRHRRRCCRSGSMRRHSPSPALSSITRTRTRSCSGW